MLASPRSTDTSTSAVPSSRGAPPRSTATARSDWPSTRAPAAAQPRAGSGDRDGGGGSRCRSRCASSAKQSFIIAHAQPELEQYARRASAPPTRGRHPAPWRRARSSACRPAAPRTWPPAPSVRPALLLERPAPSPPAGSRRPSATRAAGGERELRLDAVPLWRPRYALAPASRTVVATRRLLTARAPRSHSPNLGIPVRASLQQSHRQQAAVAQTLGFCPPQTRAGHNEPVGVYRETSRERARRGVVALAPA